MAATVGSLAIGWCYSRAIGRAQVKLRVRVHAPLEVVFEGIVDHEAMSHWPGITRSVVILEGEPRNGLGAVRAITARGLTLHEKVVHYDAPHRYDYQIIKGLPVDHLGSVRLVERGEVVELSWQVDLRSRVPLLAQSVAFMLRRGLGPALAYFKRETERRVSCA